METILSYVTANKEWKLKFVQNDFYLFSPVMDVLWIPKTPFGSNNINLIHKSEIFNTTLGIYARKFEKPILNGTVCGKVALWGLVCEHEEGFHSQFAYPLCISYLRCSTCGDVIDENGEAFKHSFGTIFMFCNNCSIGMIKASYFKISCFKIDSLLNVLEDLCYRYGIKLEERVFKKAIV